MVDDKEVRITQMKMTAELHKQEHEIEKEKLRHKQVMEALRFMAEHNITSFNLALSDEQLIKIKERFKR